jgi:hypothetical protein
MKPSNLYVEPDARVLSDRPRSGAAGRRRKILKVEGLLCGL